MLFPAARAAAADPELRGLPLSVYLVLVDELSSHHPIALKNSYVALRAGTSKRHIRRILNLLVARGYLLRGPPTAEGLHTYQLRYDWHPAASA